MGKIPGKFRYTEKETSTDNQMEKLSKEEVYSHIAKIIAEEYPAARGSEDSFSLKSFSEFYGYKRATEPEISFAREAGYYEYLIDVLEKECEDFPFKTHRPFDTDAEDNLQYRHQVAGDIDVEHNAETVALLGMISNMEDYDLKDLSMPLKIYFAADVYATYDELRRLVATCRLVTRHDFPVSVLDEYEHNRGPLLNANCDRIFVDKYSKLVEKATRMEAMPITGQYNADEDDLRDFLGKR